MAKNSSKVQIPIKNRANLCADSIKCVLTIKTAGYQRCRSNMSIELQDFMKNAMKDGTKLSPKGGRICSKRRGETYQMSHVTKLTKSVARIEKCSAILKTKAHPLIFQNQRY